MQCTSYGMSTEWSFAESIFYIPLMQRIPMRPVSVRWSVLVLDHSLLWNVSITENCRDIQLKGIFSAAKRLVTVDFFNTTTVDGSCLFCTGLRFLRHLDLTGSRITDPVLIQVLAQCREELRELHLTNTGITENCLPQITSLVKLHYISVPPETTFNKTSVLNIVETCQSLKSLDCQEGYFFTGDNVAYIVESNCDLIMLVLPHAFINNEMLQIITDRLQNLRYLCVCNTDVTHEGVQRINTTKPSLVISYNEEF